MPAATIAVTAARSIPWLCFLNPSPAKAAPSRLRWAFTGRGKPGVDIRCAVVQLKRLSAEPFLKSGNLAGVAMAACMKLPPSRRVDLAAWAYLQTLRQNLTQEEQEAMTNLVHAYLHLNEAEVLQIDEACVKLKATQKERKTMVEIKNPWIMLGMLKGEEKGEEKGRKEGRLQGEYAVIKRLLTRKLGLTGAKSEKYLHPLAEEGLLALGEALLYFQETGDLDQWLREARAGHPDYFALPKATAR